MAKLVWLKDAVRTEESIITVGTFDGVHAGHRVLIKTVVKKAEESGCRSVVVTFDPHPRDIINPGKEGIKLLSTLRERSELLTEIGVDEMVVIPFDRDFSLLSSESFIKDVIWKKIGIREIVIGYDHQFGKDRKGTIETVHSIADEIGFEVYVVSKQEVGDQAVSSTVIRNLLQDEGDVVQAAKLLKRPYMLNGRVIHGDKRGKEIGFPTANIKPEHSNKVIPKPGVYAVKVRIEDQYYDGMMNIGMRPTFEGDTETLEVHLFDFEQNIYGSAIQVRFMERIRDEMKFKGGKELAEQLNKDKERCRTILKKEQ